MSSVSDIPADQLPLVFNALLSSHRDEIHELKQAHVRELEGLVQAQHDLEDDLLVSGEVRVREEVEAAIRRCALRLYGPDSVRTEQLVEACTKND